MDNGTQPEVQREEQRVFRLNVSPNGYPPYLIVRDDHISGIFWDVMSAATRNMNVQLEAVQVPRKRVDQMLLRGYMEGSLRAPDWTREPHRFVWSDVVVYAQEVFFYLKDTEFHFDTLNDLRGKTILTHLGYKYPTLQGLFQAGEAFRFDVSQDENQLRYLLHSGRFNAAILERRVGRWIIRNNATLQDQFLVSDNSVSNVGLRLMARPDMADFVARFNAELERIKASGELDRIISRYQ
ncbi:hypothetical protein BG841_13215 [Marinobacter sp. X15-166B]|nr:hypothetical protein BG841_13215 [Marinobacter sp. X15-166B]